MHKVPRPAPFSLSVWMDDQGVWYWSVHKKLKVEVHGRAPDGNIALQKAGYAMKHLKEKKEQQMEVDRSLQDQFHELLIAMGFDGRGNRKVESSDWHEVAFGGWSNGLFTVRPFWWGECDCVSDCDCRDSAPNFEHRTTEFQMSWYKYPLRGAESNIELTAKLIAKWRLQVN